MSYNIISDYDVRPAGPDSKYVVSDAYWVVAIFRLRYPTTYSRVAKASQSTLYSEAVELRGRPMIITDDCTYLQVSGTKNSYQMQAQAALVDGGVNYLSEIFPGDYMMAWMVNNRDSYDSLLLRLSSLGDGQGQPLNKFEDGFKFSGRVQSIRKKVTQLSEGARISRYQLSAVSFNEFDAQIFYDPHLAENEPAIGSYFGRLGASLNTLLGTAGGNQAGIDVNKAIPVFLDLMLGKGIPSNLGRGNADPRLQSTAGLTASYSYILPDIIGEVLGKVQKSSNGGLTTFADVLECVIGIQKYAPAPPPNETLQAGSALISRFNPEGTLGGGSRRYTGTPMLGEFLPQVPHFTNKSVWTVLQQYLNPAVNEMYTCLRVNPDGLVVPTLIVRQLPFTSELLITDLAVTRFFELPRWGIDPVLVKDVDIGRSDALRFNFVHVYGDTVDHAQPFAAQIVRTPPIRDDLDIARSGLRSHMQTIPCGFADTRNGGPKKWMALGSDILMGQQLTMTGVITTIGIQAPIVYGDNIEWDGVLFHIESTTHVCSIQANGIKNFTTTLALSHGVKANPDLIDRGDLAIYAGTAAEDQQGFNPGLTVQNNQDIDTTTQSSQPTPSPLGDFPGNSGGFS